MRKALVHLVLALVLPAMLLSNVVAAPKRGGSVTIGIPGDADTLNPVFSENPIEIMVEQCIFSSLYRTDQDGDFVPDLLAKMPTIKGSIYEYQLRSGVKFSDGHELTAEDVKFTWQVMTNPKIGAVRRPGWSDVKSVEIPLLSYKGKDGKIYKTYDKYHFNVILSRIYAPYDLLWANAPILPKHILEKEMAAGGGLLDKNGRFSRYPVGSGPFVVKEWRPDDRIVLARNPYYFRVDQPYLDGIMFRVLPDEAGAALAKLRAGEIDICGNLRFDLFYEAVKAPGLTVHRTPSHTYNHIEINLWDAKDPAKPHPILGDKRVRQALDYAFPREAIVGEVLENVGYPAYSNLSPSSWGYGKDLAKPRFNMEKAKELLDAAGWTDGNGDGLREKDGVGLRLVIQSNAGNKVRESIEKICQEHWRRIGVELVIENLDFATLIATQAERRFDLMLLAWIAAEDPDSKSIWHSGQIPTKANGYVGQNYVGYRNPEMDELIEDGLATNDRQARRKIYHRVQEILADEVPYIFVNFYAKVSVTREGIENFRPNPGSATDLWNVYEWYWAR